MEELKKQNIFQVFGGYIKSLKGGKEMKKETNMPKPPEPPTMDKAKYNVSDEEFEIVRQFRERKEAEKKAEEHQTEEPVRVQVLSEFEVIMIKLNAIIELLQKK